MMKHALSLMTVLLSCVNVSARSYYGTPYKFSQPDGDSVSVRLFGDDLYIHAESFDGYTLIQDPEDGYICYAMVSADSAEYASSGIRYRGDEAPEAVTMIASPHMRISSDALSKKIEENKKTLGLDVEVSKPQLRAATAIPDTIYGVTVLIDFPDCKFPFTRSELDKFLNADKGSINGNERSIKEYFRWISNGKLTYINYLPKSAYTAPNNKSYYGPSNATSYTFSLMEPLVNDALNSFSKSKDGFDVTDLSVKNGEYVAVNILYAGSCPNKWATGMWPHKGSMTLTGNNDRRINKLVSQTFQLSDCSEDLGMGNFVHENFHMLLGVPDFYSFDNHHDNTAEPFNAADEFFIGRPKASPIPNPYILDAVGWLEDKIVLNNLKKGTKVNMAYGPGNVAVYYGNTDGDPEKERFYIEVRNAYYYNNKLVNVPGIYIWHAYEDGDNRYANKPEKLDCRPVSTLNPFWSSTSSSKVFSDDSNPNAKWNNGQKSGLYLCNFSDAGLKMSFCYGDCDANAGEVGFKDNDVDGSGVENPENNNQDVEDPKDNNSQQYDKLGLTNKDSLPSGKVGQKYYAKLNPVGGDGKYSIKWKSSLPDGLSLNSKFEIVGTPTVAVTKTMKLLVCDGTGAQTEVWLKLTIVDEHASVDDALAESNPVSLIYIDDAFACINNGRETVNCTVYSVNGIKVDDFVLDNGEMRIFGSNYPAGIYIVAANNKRFKIMKF